MPPFRPIIALFLALAATLPAQRPERVKADPESRESHVRLGPPKRLLATPFKWQTQAGAWRADAEAGTAACTSDGTLAEYAATSGVTLGGHWLSLRASLTGTAAKAGVWFAGVRDSRGEVLRLAFDSTSGGLIGGRGQPIATLPDGVFAQPIEIVLNFSTDKVTIHHAGRQLAEIAITFDEPQATPSLFVERGEATFTDLLLSGEPAPAPAAPVAARKPAPAMENLVPLASPAPAATPSAPAPAPVPAAAIVAVPAQWTFDFAPDKMTALKSGWNNYFGIHFETGAGPWKMIRQFDGPDFGVPAQGRHTGDVKQFPGPFAEMPVDLSLADFRDWKRRDSHSLDENLTALVRDDRQALFIAPWSGPLGKMEQDRIYALMKLTYGAIPAAEGRLYFQWGDSLNDGHYGTVPNGRKIASTPSGSVRMGRGANTAADLTACAENYLAPAIESVRRASQEIFKDPRHIPIVAGSCGAAGDPNNRAWYGQLFDRVLDGTSAPSLKGRRLSSLVDYLAVNYPLSGAENDAALQELWDRFCAPPPAAGAVAETDSRPRGLWVTEEYGAWSRGSATLVTRAARFLAWAARNNLDAQQTRLLWHISPRLRGGEEALALARTLGESFAAASLRISTQDVGDSRLIRISAGDGRLLLVHQPITVRRGRRPTPVGDIALAVTDAQAGQPWIARLYQDLGKKPAVEGAALAVRRDGNHLIVNVDATAQEPWALLVETP